jgi:alditol oxidase
MTTESGAREAGTNWAGTHHFEAGEVVSATTADEIARLVARGGRFKALGTRHAFNDMADSTGTLLDMGSLQFEPSIDEARRRVRVPAGMSYGTLGHFLEQRGWALHNLGSLPHISVAGACATSTHGSGTTNQSLAGAVCGVELVTGGGRRVVIDDEDPRLLGAVVSLGALGAATAVTLRVEPTYAVRQDVFINMPWSELTRLDTIMESAYSVSLFTRWDGIIDQVWLKTRPGTGTYDGDPQVEWAEPAAGKVMSPADDGRDNTTVQGGLAGPWNERLPHFRFEETPSNGDEIQSEYFVAREDGLPALRALEPLASAFAPHLLISELRTVAADQLWLSPAYQRDSLTIHFTWKKSPPEVQRLLPAIEDALRPFGARPHWAKWFAMGAAEVTGLYPQLPAFRSLANELDPDGQFRNDYLARTLGLND